MATLETIAAAIKEIDRKKENLKKAYDDLQSHSPLLSSFSLSWSDLDAHFTNIQNSLTNRFRLLHSQPTPPHHPSHSLFISPSLPPQHLHSSPPQFDSITLLQSHPQPSSTHSLVPPPGLSTLCENMDGKGLIKFINDNSKHRESIRFDLPGAIRVAMDPGLMILDAMEGFYGADDSAKGDKDQEALGGIRRACLLLLEVLIGINVNIGKEARERAKNLAFTWKAKVKLDGHNNLEVLGFLHLVAAYGLGCEFEKNDLVEFLVIVARSRQGTLLCKAIDLGDKAQGMV